MRVSAVFTGCAVVGGIAQYNLQTAAAFRSLIGQHGGTCEFLDLNDPPGYYTYTANGETFAVRGFGRDKARLIAHALRRAPVLDLIYLGHPNLAPLGLSMKVVNPRLRYWVAAHGYEIWEPVALHRRLGLRLAAGVAAVSADTAMAVERCQGVDSKRVAILPNSLDPGFAGGPIGERPEEIPLGSQVLITVGRLWKSEPGKGVETVLRALPSILASAPSTLYLVVGDGDLRPNLERLAADLGVRSRVHFMGAVAPDVLRSCYRMADVYVMPSRQEGFGIVFLEAMAFKKPVIGGRHGGTPDVIDDGITGFLVEHDSTSELADRVIHLLQDSTLRERMGQAGYDRLQRRFTFKAFRRRLGDLLELPHGVEDRVAVDVVAERRRNVQ